MNSIYYYTTACVVSINLFIKYWYNSNSMLLAKRKELRRERKRRGERRTAKKMQECQGGETDEDESRGVT